MSEAVCDAAAWLTRFWAVTAACDARSEAVLTVEVATDLAWLSRSAASSQRVYPYSSMIRVVARMSLPQKGRAGYSHMLSGLLLN